MMEHLQEQLQRLGGKSITDRKAAVTALIHIARENPALLPRRDLSRNSATVSEHIFQPILQALEAEFRKSAKKTSTLLKEGSNALS